MSDNPTRRKYRIITVVVLLLGLCVVIWFRRTPATMPVRSPIIHSEELLNSHPGNAEILVGPVTLLPFEGQPISPATRPDIPMPISKNIYAKAELFLDDQLVSDQTMHLKSGRRMCVRGTIWGTKGLRNDVGIDGGIALACKADNTSGWVIMQYSFFDSHTEGFIGCLFHGDWVVPELQGEFLLVVVSSAHIGSMDHRSRLAAAYPVVVE